MNEQALYLCPFRTARGFLCDFRSLQHLKNFLPTVVHHSIPVVIVDFHSAQFHRFCRDSETIANEKHPFSHWKFSLGKSQEISRSHGNFLLFLPNHFSRKSLSISLSLSARNLKVSDFEELDGYTIILRLLELCQPTTPSTGGVVTKRPCSEL